MKTRQIALLVVILVVSAVMLADAAKGAAKAAGGLKGKITSIGASAFTMTLAGKPAGYDTRVDCDLNTKFMRQGVPVPPNTIAVGMTVTVAGAAIEDYRVRALLVTILGDAPTTQPAKKK